jgi:hypothetical protein
MKTASPGVLESSAGGLPNSLPSTSSDADIAPAGAPDSRRPKPRPSAANAEIPRRKKPRDQFRGTPPPLTYDIDALPASTFLNETETAAAIRRNKSTLEYWRTQPNHPLRWRRIAGRILYELPAIREFLKGTK